MLACPSSPILRAKSRSLTPDAAVNISSKLRRNSLVSDHEDMVLLREKLTRIAVGRHRQFNAAPGAQAIDEEEEEEQLRRRRSSGAAHEHFKVFPLLPPERPSTPPSSPQPRDVLRKQLWLKQQAARTRRGDEEDAGLDALMSVDEVEISAMDVEEDNAVHSPPRGRKSPQARLSIPGHLRVMSSFSVLNKYPEGLRKRKSVHVDASGDGEDDPPRVSLKKTSSQINLLATSSGKLSRSSSAGGDLFQTFAARQRHEQDHEMEDAGCTTQPQSPQNARFGSKQGRLSACS
ncbi:hypothetical protein PR003_g4625 [Phytophthora rubi]|uniref:Uncharacterized protein n=1 Tax=Phytophthora rubi TaxID=129364 RepID=A0A6A3NKG1_9STRA|nr:hypothetical protein PR002_g7371 [Phytophthora rubi]KAE9040885.1 hypothetical protein PR001_g6870 [Phytophthora rubi]KAE9351971.1 hypothetical protein PR003_g4625 [Phytophthora rubi]